MRHKPGVDLAFDAQMLAIAQLPIGRRLHWLAERRRTLWELATESVRRSWVQQWLDGPHHFTLEEFEHARAKVRDTNHASRRDE